MLLFDARTLLAIDRGVDLRGPTPGILAVARVQGEVQLFLCGSQFVKGGLDVFLEVVGHGDDEKGVVGEDTPSTLEVLEGEATIAFSRYRANLVEVVFY